jgi:hypothetical protein
MKGLCFEKKLKPLVVYLKKKLHFNSPNSCHQTFSYR